MALALADPNRKGKVLLNHLETGGKRKDCPVYAAPSMPPAEAFRTDGLPKAFLHSLRTLFDILDDGRLGYVHLSEIESRWRGAEASDLPAGVLESLRRVAPLHGRLTFERFVAGLRNSMFNPGNSSSTVPLVSNPPRLKSQQRLGDSALPFECKVRPLGPSNGLNTLRSRQSNRGRHHESSGFPDKHALSSHLRATSAELRGRGGIARSGRLCQVRSTERLGVETSEKALERVGLPRSQSEMATGFSGSRWDDQNPRQQRRHTLTNGVDYGMLKQMKELEQEKDSLLAGLDVLEQAREWYQTQIHGVSEAQRHIGQCCQSSEVLAECSEGSLDALLPKLQEVTRCLSDLLSHSGKEFPSAGGAPAAPQAVHILKEQNRLLTQEVTEKSERITQLEQEKSALIKQLFEARARSSAHDASVLDSTFI